MTFLLAMFAVLLKIAEVTTVLLVLHLFFVGSRGTACYEEDGAERGDDFHGFLVWCRPESSLFRVRCCGGMAMGYDRSVLQI
mmetsp:Transcript_29304/g.63594  ORF Transcript_29304/g.63594 Transcript_29304/m.63594 type:complete len:82 (+) Transcript_29304:585-830(+)